MTLSMDSVAKVGDDPVYTPYGYVIDENANVYSLVQKWCHGVVLALLYPDEAIAHGVGIPDEDFDVFAFQRFEMNKHTLFPVVRIALGLVSDFNISKGEMPATEKQIRAVAKCIRIQDRSLNDKVQTDLRSMTARSALKELLKDERID